LSLLLWISSTITPFTYRHAIDSAFAGMLPTATPRSQPRWLSSAAPVFLPFIAGDNSLPLPPPAPPPTTSRYVTTTDPQKLYDAGCSQGRAGPNGIVVLFFGDPYSYYDNSGRLVYGATLPSVGTIVSTDTISVLVSEFAQGDYNCSPANAHVRLATGVTNNGAYVNREHGIAWGQLVTDIQATIDYPPSMGDKIAAAGAVNAKLQWNTPTNTRAWVDGYTSSTNYIYLYNVGNCPGCNYPTGAPGAPWTWEHVWYISWGARSNLPLPMIYAKSGTHATQWHSMSVYTYEQKGAVPMRFVGAFTQYDACHDPNNIPEGPNCIRDGLDNTPTEGWTELYNAQNADERTVQNLNWSTDVTWKK
jgi:hypothetical protein